MVAQILCIFISSEPSDFLISYFSRGCSLSFNAFFGYLFRCFQFEEAPPGWHIFSIQVVWEELIMISNRINKILKEIPWNNRISKTIKKKRWEKQKLNFSVVTEIQSIHLEVKVILGIWLYYIKSTSKMNQTVENYN